MRHAVWTGVVLAILAAQLFTLYVLLRLVAAIEALATVLSLR